MNFLSISFFVFFTFFLIAYYLTPNKKKYVALVMGSYFFYGFADYRYIFILLLVTTITYIGGILIERYHSKKVYWMFFTLDITVLLIFKYIDFTISNLGRLLNHINPLWSDFPELRLILPIGLSFYVFQSATYLTEVYRDEIPFEKNYLRYAAFVAYFPTILSGPIQNAKNLMPQISNPSKPNQNDIKKGVIFIVWGIFEKLVVASSLATIVANVFDNIQSMNPRQQSAYLIVGSICFSLYIYADFSSYSDLARGISKFLGIDVGRNFMNPYLSKSTSEFWRTWHVSLNDWFIENIYISLGGNRKGTIRKYLNVMIIFLISGLWHGANWHFVAWGGVNGLFVIFGQMLKPIKNKCYATLHVDQNLESIVFIKRCITFWLITISWVFFRNGIYESLYIVRKITFFAPIRLFVPEIFSISGTVTTTMITLLMTGLFCKIQKMRVDEEQSYIVFARQPQFLQCVALAILLCISFYAFSANQATVNTDFMYFNF